MFSIFNKRKVTGAKFPSFCLKELNVKLTDGDLYCTRYSYVEILKVMGESIHMDQIDEIKDSKWFSIVIDESTDQGKVKDEMIYEKHLNRRTGKIITRFLKLLTLTDFTAKGITELTTSKSLFFNYSTDK